MSVASWPCGDQPTQAPPKNRVEERIQKAVVEIALEKPTFVQVRVANEFTKRVSPTGVRNVWLRHGLKTFRKRLKALEAKAAQEAPLSPRNSYAPWNGPGRKRRRTAKSKPLIPATWARGTRRPTASANASIAPRKSSTTAFRKKASPQLGGIADGSGWLAGGAQSDTTAFGEVLLWQGPDADFLDSVSLTQEKMLD